MFAPSEETKWTRGEAWDDVHFRMGGLHSCNTKMSTIGDHIAGSEIPEMWINAGIVTEVVANKILMGKDFKAGLITHKITFQAAWKILRPQLMEFIQETNLDLFNDINALKGPENIKPLITRLDSDEFRLVMEQFIETKKQD